VDLDGVVAELVEVQLGTGVALDRRGIVHQGAGQAF
jgi:hypothetical protein